MISSVAICCPNNSLKNIRKGLRECASFFQGLEAGMWGFVGSETKVEVSYFYTTLFFLTPVTSILALKGPVAEKFLSWTI
jgi:hypothetical protein